MTIILIRLKFCSFHNEIFSFITEKLNCTSNAFTLPQQEVRKAPAVRSNLSNTDLPQCGPETYKSPKSPQLPTVSCQSPNRLLINNSNDSIKQHIPISLKTSQTQDTAQLLSATDKHLRKSQSETFSKWNSSGSKSITEKSPSSIETIPNSNLRTSQMQVDFVFIFF